MAQLAKQKVLLLQENAPFKPDYAAVREDIARLLDDEDYDDGMPSQGSQVLDDCHSFVKGHAHQHMFDCLPQARMAQS